MKSRLISIKTKVPFCDLFIFIEGYDTGEDLNFLVMEIGMSANNLKVCCCIFFFIFNYFIFHKRMLSKLWYFTLQCFATSDYVPGSFILLSQNLTCWNIFEYCLQSVKQYSKICILCDLYDKWITLVICIFIIYFVHFLSAFMIAVVAKLLNIYTRIL